MYLNFYGLNERPFNTTPDPGFLFLTPGHREALAQLVYGVREQKGFVVLTGEVGTGKTTLLRALLQRLDATTSVAYVTHGALPFDGLLEYALEDFGIPNGERTVAGRLVALNSFLIERRRAGQTAVLILDEAQDLDPRTLEQVRLLSNFETTSEKLLQIVLAGQPELAAKLRLPELRQLEQRIGLRCRVPELTPQETRQYIRTRLRIAGATDLALFTDAAVRRIVAYAKGIPRVVNLLCDHCLVIGYAEQTRRIDCSIVEQAIKYRGEALPTRRVAGGVRYAMARGEGGRLSSVVRWAVVTACGVTLGVTVGVLVGGVPEAISRGLGTYAGPLLQAIANLVGG